MENSAVKKREVPAGRRLIDLVFSWSIEDVLNEDLYKNQVCPHCKKLSCNACTLESTLLISLKFFC